jgi:hypothetical protein
MVLIDLNSTDGSLRPGDRLISRSMNGRTLIIPEFNHPIIRQLYEESQKYITSDNSESCKIEVLTALVYEHFKDKSEVGLPKVHDLGDLGYVLERQQGVCKDHAATLQILFQLYGISSRYLKGFCGDYGHAWLRVSLKNGKDVLIDPSFNYSGCSYSYDEFKRILPTRKEGMNYLEDSSTMIERN